VALIGPHGAEDPGGEYLLHKDIKAKEECGVTSF
jgi:hypothetical protein